MGDLNQFGRFLVLGGVLMLGVGLIFVLPGWFLPGGRLPGDIAIARPRFLLHSASNITAAQSAAEPLVAALIRRVRRTARR